MQLPSQFVPTQDAPKPEVAFSYWLRELRETHEPKISQTALAEKVGLDPTAITKIEGGTRSVRLNEAVALAAALGCDVVDMLRPPKAKTLREELDVARGELLLYRQKLKTETQIVSMIQDMITQLERRVARLEQRVAEEEGEGGRGEHQETP